MGAILAEGEEQETKMDNDGGGLGGNSVSLFDSLVGGGTKEENNAPPRTLMDVIANTGEAVTGAPESSPESSPFRAVQDG